MKVTILYPNSFPIGGAATNRVLHIAKAVNEGGAESQIIVTRGTEKKNKNINNDTIGRYEGIPFTYSNKSTIWPEKKYKKLFNLVLGIFRAIHILLKDKDKIDVILSYADYSLFNNLIIFIFCKINRITFVYAVDEYPWCLIYKDKYLRIYRWFYLKFFYRLFDGMIVITIKLRNYYHDKTKRNCKFFHLPMTVEIERFKKRNTEDLDSNYIAYCGGEPENYNKDGVNILIEAFSIISPKFVDLKLYLIGKANNNWQKQVEKLKLKEKVIFIGNVHRDEIPDYLMNAKILALARPTNTQSDGGFPTKLGEYLATGKPVVIADVGEIAKYLKDGLNAFLVKPDNPEFFAEKLELVLRNYESSTKVGLKGKETAFSIFDYRNYAEKLNLFFLEL